MKINFRRAPAVLGAITATTFLALSGSAGCSDSNDGSSVGSQPCTTNEDCQVGVCGTNRRCTTGSSTPVGMGGGGGIPIPTAGTGNGSSSAGSPGTCATGNAMFSRDPPNVMLVVDQSLSMAENFGGGTRWSVLEEVLIGDPDGIVPQLHQGVRFGLTLYSVAVMGGGGGQCPALITVPLAPMNLGPISTAYTNADPLGATPTGESLQQVIPGLTADTAPGAKVIILATDGEPNTCDDPNPPPAGQFHAQGRANSLAAVSAAWNAGITTYVISVGEDVGEEHLRAVANLGQGFPENDNQDRFYTATSQQELEQAIQDIFMGIDCIFQLNGMVDAAGAGQGTVTLGGQLLAYMTDWRLVGNDRVELLGQACQTALEQGDAVTVSANFPCGVFIEDPPE